MMFPIKRSEVYLKNDPEMVLQMCSQVSIDNETIVL